MRTNILILLNIFFMMNNGFSQDLDPTTTELWKPVPKHSTPGENGAPPSDAIVLFNGSSLSQWESVEGGEAQWIVANNAMTVEPKTGNIRTKASFGSVQLHIEWRTPEEITGEGQGRGNSGIFLMGRYELQVLDSYNNETYANGQAASIYKQHIPLVNACKKPGEWQTYDIVFTAPVFGENDRIIHPAYITVMHNGILVHNHVAIWGPTEYRGLPTYEKHGKAPIVLQDHSNRVSYRNIWIREL